MHLPSTAALLIALLPSIGQLGKRYTPQMAVSLSMANEWASPARMPERQRERIHATLKLRLLAHGPCILILWK
jgi:hypothetical protein